MNYLEKNLNLLNPLLRDKIISCSENTVSTIITPKGLPVVEVVSDGKKTPLHSRFDPVKEAERFVSEISDFTFDLFVIYGFASAYHVEIILKEIGKYSHILIIERSPEVLKQSLESRDLSTILKDERVIICADPDESEFAELLKGKSTNRVTFIFHRGSAQVFGDYYNNINNSIKTYFSNKEVNIATLSKFERLWSSNSARNIRRITETIPVNVFFNKFNNIPAIIVCAGPSLTDSIDFIKANKDKAVIIAVDTSYYLLKRYSIEPHFCVSVDPQIINARYFENSSETETVLVTDPSTHPSVFRFFKGRTVMISSLFENIRWIEKITGEKGEVTHGGSVSTNAYDFALKIGANPIILTGQDLSFTSGLAHARGSYLDEQMHIKTNRFFSEQDFNRKQLSALPKIFMKGIKSPQIFTNQKMIIFKNWFEKHNSPSLINASSDGVILNGIKHEKSEDIKLSSIKDLNSFIDEIYNSAPNGNIYLNEVRDKFERIFNEIESYYERACKAKENSEKLVLAIKTDSQNEIRHLIKKLDELDNYLESRKTVCDIIGLSMQKVIHTLTEGYESEDDKHKPENLKIAERSAFMYKAMEESLRFNLRLAEKMKTILLQ
ncbi:MAG TPA: DUF115 domain-containing protein [Spirochaetota bacterium]|nr:DUF115 domain-containing protein [Spirochaetota bacterium]